MVIYELEWFKEDFQFAGLPAQLYPRRYYHIYRNRCAQNSIEFCNGLK